jgi:hypothetical protein
MVIGFRMDLAVCHDDESRGRGRVDHRRLRQARRRVRDFSQLAEATSDQRSAPLVRRRSPPGRPRRACAQRSQKSVGDGCNACAV